MRDVGKQTANAVAKSAVETIWGGIFIGVSKGIGAFAFSQLLQLAGSRLLESSELARRKYWGSRYVDGIWVGTLTTPSGETISVVEYYHQDRNGIRISGESYRPGSLKRDAAWTTNNIDHFKGDEFTCRFDTVMFRNERRDSTTQRKGTGAYFVRPSTSKHPTVLQAFADDDGVLGTYRYNELKRLDDEQLFRVSTAQNSQVEARLVCHELFSI